MLITLHTQSSGSRSIPVLKMGGVEYGDTFKQSSLMYNYKQESYLCEFSRARFPLTQFRPFEDTKDMTTKTEGL